MNCGAQSSVFGFSKRFRPYRDVNAAKNLLRRSIEDATLKATEQSKEQTAGGGPVAACGEEGSGRRRKTAVKPASAKQGVNHELAFAPGYE